MVEFSNIYGCWIWTCEWGHRGIDFEGAAEAIMDFAEHHCDRRI